MEDYSKLDKEKCIICGKETIYNKDTDILIRACYIEGAGQLCFDCNKKLYDKEKI